MEGDRSRGHAGTGRHGASGRWGGGEVGRRAWRDTEAWREAVLLLPLARNERRRREGDMVGGIEIQIELCISWILLY